MSRCLPYRIGCTIKCVQAQNDALNSTFFIVRQTGPTAFVLKEDDERTYKVFLGNPHKCTCSTFQRDHELCKHICWLLLKRFRVPRSNPMLWQRGLVEREINELLRELTRNTDERNKANRNYITKNDDENSPDVEVEQRPVGETDVCPICQEELLNQRAPITYCRRGCGNNVHVKCMKIWLDHQVSTGEKAIRCPLCRELFGTSEQLTQQFRALDVQHADTISMHLGFTCHRCHACPITGKCYKCTVCQDYFLCQTCFNSNTHHEHSFDYREKSFQSWKVAAREHLRALPNALQQMLVNRELSEDDYDTLMQLENAQNFAIASVPDDVVKAMPTQRINEQSQLLKSGEKCRICMRSYQTGERVRRLPCRHKFHIDCIDGWLLHSHSTCPIDGQLVWSLAMNNEQAKLERPSSSVPRKMRSTPETATNLILRPVSMGLAVVSYQTQIPNSVDLNQQSRCFRMPISNRRLLTSVPIENSSLLSINGQRVTNQSSNLLLSENVEQPQLRRQSCFSSKSFRTRDTRRTNNGTNAYSTLSTNHSNNRLLQHRSLSAK